jgi:hypothetical protein
VEQHAGGLVVVVRCRLLPQGDQLVHLAGVVVAAHVGGGRGEEAEHDPRHGGMDARFEHAQPEHHPRHDVGIDVADTKAFHAEDDADDDDGGD